MTPGADSDNSLSIERVISEPELEIVRGLVRDYADELGEDSWLCAADLEDQLAELPGVYAEPDGCILLARWNDRPAGCVLLEPVNESTAEMHRLYVKPQFRGKGLGRRLTEDLIERVRLKGYKTLRLVTTQSMTEARSLYRSLGFEETDPFHDYGDEFIYMMKGL